MLNLTIKKKPLFRSFSYMTRPCLYLNSKTFSDHIAIATHNIHITINTKIIFLMIASKIPFQFIFNKSG